MIRKTIDNETWKLNDHQAGLLLRLARAALEGEVQAGELPAWIAGQEMPPAAGRVNVTLRCDGRLRGSMGATGESLPEAVVKAARRSARDDRFAACLAPEECARARVEVWCEVATRKLPPAELKKQFVLGVHGLSIRRGDCEAYYKPSVAISSDVNNLGTLLAKIAKKAGLEEDDWSTPDTELWMSDWEHFVEDSRGQCLRMQRLRPIQSAVCNDRQAVTRRMLSTCQRLRNTQRRDGAYQYVYHPFKDAASNKGFNIVRMAGAAYSIAAAADTVDDLESKAELELSARRGLCYLFRTSRPFRGRRDALFIATGNSPRNRHEGKLGATALTLLTLQFGNLPEIYAEHRRLLLKTILEMQKDDGSFECYVHQPTESRKIHNFYAGEALVAICHEARRSRDSKLIDAMARAFPWYRDFFREQPDTAFVLWQSDAWRMFFELLVEINGADRAAPPEEYADFVFEQVDWLLEKHQYTPARARFPEYVGGFPYPDLPRYSTGVYVEGAIRACGLADRLGRREAAARYRQASLAGLSFLSRLQLTEENAFLFPKPDRAIGGITKNLSNFTIRNDYDQHAITAWIAALQTPGLWKEQTT